MTLVNRQRHNQAVDAVVAWIGRNPGWYWKVQSQAGGYIDIELWKPPFTAVVGTFANADELVKFLEQQT